MKERIKEVIENIKFHRIAERAKKYSNKDNHEKCGKLECILEENNRCLCCGSEQFFDQEYYNHYGMWKCPQCDDGVELDLISKVIIKIISII